MTKITASTDFEKEFWQQGVKHIAGLDEVGRGAWAGPVVVGAVIFPPYFTTDLPINDSKKVPTKLRETLAEEIKKLALAYSIIEINLNVINSYGIGYAAQLGFAQAVASLNPTPDHILMDAFLIKSISPAIQTPIIHGDVRSLSIAAASIIAKVHRDLLMQDIHQLDPRYGFNKHVGYGTVIHRQAMKAHGLSQYHRISYNLSKWL